MIKVGLHLFIFTFLASVAGAGAFTAEECIRCHEAGSRESSLHVSTKDYETSVHGRASMSCPDCHRAIQDERHRERKGGAGVSCRECHEKENGHAMGSAHDRRPACHSCHTAHLILEKGNKLSSIHPDSLQRTCSPCHPTECGQGGYLSWFPSLQVISHGKADFSRKYGKGNCVGCHQGDAAHGEKTPIDAQDCYKCHRSMWGYIHPKAEPGKNPGLFAAALLYQALGLALIGGGLRLFTLRFRRHRRTGT